MDEKKLERLWDKSQIEDVIATYARGVDRRDWDLVRSVYFEDATDNHGDFAGSAMDFVDWIGPRHAQVEKSTHFLGNIVIDFASGELAVAETYFIALLKLGQEAGQHRKMLSDDGGAESGSLGITVVGRYVDRFEKRAGDWRIADRTVVFDQLESRASLDALGANRDWALGRRDASDPLYAQLARIGYSKDGAAAKR